MMMTSGLKGAYRSSALEAEISRLNEVVDEQNKTIHKLNGKLKAIRIAKYRRIINRIKTWVAKYLIEIEY